ncbi:hypothetical protein AL01_04135 [Bombella intestini]|uniref:Uncharacterized protein n=1 Tax=Bombella intestini TaxID=1539051 RepID=A0A1S8GQF1_9PROT|nr:WYL domain-containing protein [Bombella intestini]OOL18926.1 hypothetical protein AL01_04135 [Bombella intestini]
MRKEKLADIIKLARRLSVSAEGMTLDEIASYMQVSRRTAERIRDVLQEAFPGMDVLTDGPKHRFRLPAGIMDRFMNTPTADEMAALQNAATSLERQNATGRALLLSELYKKIESMLRPPARTRLAPDINALVLAEGDAMQAGPRPTADATLLHTIRHALKAGHALHFTYQATKNAKKRTVSPWGLLYGKAYYLVGPMQGVETPVLWRLDRLQDVTEAGPATLPPEDWSLQDFANRSFGVWQNKQYDVALRFSPTAAADARRFLFHPSQTVTDEKDGSLHVTFTASGLHEMAYHLFTWGKEVTILAPTELRTILLEMCQNVIQCYQK